MKKKGTRDGWIHKQSNSENGVSSPISLAESHQRWHGQIIIGTFITIGNIDNTSATQLNSHARVSCARKETQSPQNAASEAIFSPPSLLLERPEPRNRSFIYHGETTKEEEKKQNLSDKPGDYWYPSVVNNVGSGIWPCVGLACSGTKPSLCVREYK